MNNEQVNIVMATLIVVIVVTSIIFLYVLYRLKVSFFRADEFRLIKEENIDSVILIRKRILFYKTVYFQLNGVFFVCILKSTDKDKIDTDAFDALH
jgi:hypothetical protein